MIKKPKPKPKPSAANNSPPDAKPSLQGIGLLAQGIVEQRFDLVESAYRMLRKDLDLPPSEA